MSITMHVGQTRDNVDSCEAPRFTCNGDEPAEVVELIRLQGYLKDLARPLVDVGVHLRGGGRPHGRPQR